MRPRGWPRKNLVATLVTAVLIFSAQGAQATWTNYLTSPPHTGIVSKIPANYDVMQMHFGTNDADPANYYFYLNFVKPIRATMYADGLGSYAELRFDLNLDGKYEYAIRTDPAVAYTGTLIHPALLIDLATGLAPDGNNCVPGTFTDVASGASWIGFSVSKTCLSFGKKLGVMGRSVHDPRGKAEIDWVPASEWKIALGASPSPTPAATSTISGELPTSIANPVPLTLTPAKHPANLVDLAANMAKSVVTIICGTGLGSGWAAQAKLSTSLTSGGYKTYLITNFHVIRDCTASKTVQIMIGGTTRVTGVVWAWDEVNDVAAVAMKTPLPGLVWAGERPQIGWWVGIEGSPLGYPGVLTDGLLSSVATDGYLATTNAHINPGNSGGPVFDRTGRVIGISTAKYVDTVGFGILHGTPSLCVKVFSCKSVDDIWVANNSVDATVSASPEPTSTPGATLESLHDAAQMLLQGALNVLNHSIKDLNVAIKQYPKSAATLQAFLKLAPKAPAPLSNADEEINAISGFVKATSDFELLVNAKIAAIAASSAHK